MPINNTLTLPTESSSAFQLSSHCAFMACENVNKHHCSCQPVSLCHVFAVCSFVPPFVLQFCALYTVAPPLSTLPLCFMCIDLLTQYNARVPTTMSYTTFLPKTKLSRKNPTLFKPRSLLCMHSLFVLSCCAGS